MALNTLIIQTLVGLSSGMILFIVASGLSLIFGVMRVINFAHGSIYMLGAFLATAIGAWLTLQQANFFVVLVFAPLVIALLGAVLEMSLFRRIYQKEHLLQLLLTYGITLILGDVVKMIWGGEAYRLALPEFLEGSIKIFERRLPTYSLLLLVVGPTIALGLWFLLQKTRWGRMIRAAVSNPQMVSALGIPVQWVFTGVFALGCWLAGVGGVLIAGRSAVSIGMDVEIIVQTFAVVVIGGLGSFWGALLGAMIIGVVTAIGTLIPAIAGFAQALPFLVMAIVLVLRPYGLLGKPDRR